MKAVVVLSGGQDSTTCLFWALQKYGQGNVCALGFDYNQRHIAELDCAAKICQAHGVQFDVIELPAIAQLTSNSLTNMRLNVDTAATQGTPPNSLVEGRNILFLTYAAIYAKGKSARSIIVGVGQADSSGYPDCRDNFVKACNLSLNLGMDYQFEIETPLMWLTKAQTWQLAHDLGVLEIIKNQTITCYNGAAGSGCGRCPACHLRTRGYEEFVVQNMQQGDKNVPD